MCKILYWSKNGNLFFQVKNMKDETFEFMVGWVDKNNEIQIFSDTLSKLAKQLELSGNLNSLESLATDLDKQIGKVFQTFESRPQNDIFEFDRYFDGKVIAPLTTIREAITLYFKHTDKLSMLFLVKLIFLCIVKELSHISNVYVEDNRVQNKLRMQRIANRENPYGNLPEIQADINEEDILIQTMNVANMLNRLSPELKRRVIKYYFEGYTLREIAEQENVDYSAIYQSLKRAIKSMSEIE